MNKNRRKEIAKQIERLNSIKESLESICSEEEFSFDNMPENLQGSNKGIESEDAIDVLNEAIDSLNDIVDNLFDISR